MLAPSEPSVILPQILTNTAIYDNVLQLVNQAPDPELVRQSLSARMLSDNGISTYGGEVTDMIAAQKGEKAAHYYTNPYWRPAAGSTVMVTLTDPETEEVYALLGRKYKDSKNPQHGLGEFIAPGGYGKQGENLMHTALRELQEETGLRLPAGYQPQSLGVDSNPENNQHVHTINQFFHVNLIGKPQDMPALQAQDDLASLEWVNIKNIAVNPSIGAQADGSADSRYHVATDDGIVNLRDLHGAYLEQAVIAARQSVIQPVQQQATTPSEPQSTEINNSKWQDFVAAQRAKYRMQDQSAVMSR